MTKTNLGRICFVPRGTYSASESYKRLDVVSSPDNGISYVAIADSTGAALTDETKWQVMVDNSAAIRQLKNDVSAITPDDTVVDGKPWTSKKTVDSLCMPLEASGNPVQVYPVEGYPLGVKVSWEPVQAGEGDPTPENIRPISGRDAVSVTRAGKNLLPISTFSDLGISYSDGYYNVSVITDSSPTERRLFGNWGIQNAVSIGLKAGTYVWRADSSSVDGGAICKAIIRVSAHGTEDYESWTAGISRQINDDDKFFIMLYFGDSNTTYKCKIGIQIELGSTATPYEPYTGSTTDIALPETVYGGTLDVETGVVTVDRRLILKSDITNADPGEGSHQISIAGAGCFVYRSGDAEKTAAHITNTKMLCTSMPVNTQSNLYNGGDGGVVGCAVWWSTNIGIGTGDKTMETVRAFKEWWESNGGDIVYPLATPYTIQLTPQQIAALSGLNTLYTDAGTLTVTGREDPRHTIVTLTDRIAALESAAAGV